MYPWVSLMQNIYIYTLAFLLITSLCLLFVMPNRSSVTDGSVCPRYWMHFCCGPCERYIVYSAIAHVPYFHRTAAQIPQLIYLPRWSMTIAWLPHDYLTAVVVAILECGQLQYWKTCNICNIEIRSVAFKR